MSDHEESGFEAAQANGYPLGRPGDRARHPLDTVIEAAIAEIPAATRLYPDVFAWKVTDAVLAAIAERGTHTDVRRQP